VVAINLLIALTKQALNTKYVSKNSASRHVFKRKLTGTIRGSRFDSLFVGSGAFSTTPANIFDILLVDEVHRLNEFFWVRVPSLVLKTLFAARKQGFLMFRVQHGVQ
jgi:hypothetical protein